ncbi:hypothetical protein [Bacillus sp. FJAT-45037]|uniref:hypothetical protein n=1 Tax=Bacillus sp. FJAT-45037 TaxID=2011007 RepID=UPI000C2489DE|nr:hypothetical protein [Bacillus sp. FJAT-45037]
MAHLIKLEDYVSRYQSDMQRYPNQFSRMKKDRWKFIKSEWERLQTPENRESSTNRPEGMNQEKGHNFLSQAVAKMKNWKSTKVEEHDMVTEEERETVDHTLSLEELKNQFLDDLYHSQLRWASSSLLEESSLHPRYKRDDVLRFFTQQLPDNYFVMYRPVFFIKKAPIELEILLITPNEIICVSLLDGQEHSVFEASSDRFWTEYIDETRKKRISPLLSLSRMSGVIGPILEEAGISVPIRKVVFANQGIIDHRIPGSKVELIDRRGFESWHEKLKRNPSPIKHQQQKVAQLLLATTHTLSYHRQSEKEN